MERLKMERRHPAPAHLADATRKWWKAVVSTYDLEQHHLRLLQLAGEAWDRCQAAREAIGRLGMTYDADGSPRPRPEIAIERDSRLAVARLIRELDLDIDAPVSARVAPPALRSNRRSA
jgi:phage terminase small subunit